MLFRRVWDFVSKNLSDDDKEFFVFVLGFFLFLVLGWGLFLGLVLVFGLGKKAFLSILIIIATLFGVYGLTTDPTYSTNIFVVVAVTVAASEILFLFDKQKPVPKQSRFWFTAKVKVESYVDVASVGAVWLRVSWRLTSSA